MNEIKTAVERTTSEPKRDPSPNWLEIEGRVFRTCFNRRPFLIRHRLADHPLFSLRLLAELSKRLPEESVKYNGADIPISTPLYHGPRTGLSTEETIRQIEDCGSWMVLKNVEIDPAYRELFDQCLDDVQRHSESTYPGMREREAFIFISSPGAVTPYHMDPEHNFLLQIRGTKQIHIWDGWDRSVLSEIELEEYFSGNERQLVFREEVREKASPFALAPGAGVHVPITTPHWVQNGEDVSISFSITFQTHRSERQQIVHRVNQRLRRLGVTPTPFAASRAGDSLKYGAFVAARTIQRWLSDRKPTRPGS